MQVHSRKDASAICGEEKPWRETSPLHCGPALSEWSDAETDGSTMLAVRHPWDNVLPRFGKINSLQWFITSDSDLSFSLKKKKLCSGACRKSQALGGWGRRTLSRPDLSWETEKMSTRKKRKTKQEKEMLFHIKQARALTFHLLRWKPTYKPVHHSQ